MGDQAQRRHGGSRCHACERRYEYQECRRIDDDEGLGKREIQVPASEGHDQRHEREARECQREQIVEIPMKSGTRCVGRCDEQQGDRADRPADRDHVIGMRGISQSRQSVDAGNNAARSDLLRNPERWHRANTARFGIHQWGRRSIDRWQAGEGLRRTHPIPRKVWPKGPALPDCRRLILDRDPAPGYGAQGIAGEPSVLFSHVFDNPVNAEAIRTPTPDVSPRVRSYD